MSSEIPKPTDFQAKETLRVYRGEVDIFIPQNQEQEYLNKHGIIIQRLRGATIYGATRRVTDNASSSVSFSFPSGAHNEPKGKRGINHLLEHLISNRPGKFALSVDGSYNATTSAISLGIQMGGIANPHVREYGLWPILPKVLQEITKPLQVTEAELESEKGVVIGEIHQYNANPQTRLGRMFSEIVYASTNPARYDVLGSEEDVRSIALEEMKQRHDDIFIPQGLDVTVYTEGDPNTTRALIDEVTEGLKDMPMGSQPPVLVDEEIYAQLHPDLKIGEQYVRNTGLNDKMVTINYLWPMQSEGQFSASTFALSQYFKLASHKFFSFFREAGLGYISSPIDHALGTQIRLLGFTMNIPTREDIQDFAKALYPLLRQQVFDTIGEDAIEYINTLTRNRHKATPITYSDRLNDAAFGLKHYGRCIDGDRITKIYDTIAPSHLKHAQDQFTSIEPAIVILGDITSKHE